MIDVAISQLTTARWELSQEVACFAEHGFENISIWRSKLSDIGIRSAVTCLRDAGLRASSLQWAGGFTGSDGRSFAESVADATEAIEQAAELSAGILVVHSGCRGGHTRSHAVRLLGHALDHLTPIAAAAGVTLALKPLHPVAADGCSFLTSLEEAVRFVELRADPTIRVALDLWHFGDAPALGGLLPMLATATAVVQVADRVGVPAAGMDRLPVGHGSLPLESVIADLVELGYEGPVEFDPVGESVELLGYPGVVHESSLVADAWRERFASGTCPIVEDFGPAYRQLRGDISESLRGVQRLPAGSAAGSRKSHASSQTVSRG
jgi:sugar phosphate isomerase/epimerase